MWSFMELLHSEIFPCYTGKRCRHTPFTSTRTKSLKSSRPPASFSLSYIELWTNCGTNSVIFFCEQKNFLYYHKDKKFVIVAVLQKISEKTKKDRDLRQRTDDLSSVLSDSHGHPDISSIYFVALAFARLLPLALFPLSEIHSSVIWSVSACLCFYDTTFVCLLKGNLPKLFKPQQNPNFCTPFHTFRLGDGGRASLSVKGAQ